MGKRLIEVIKMNTEWIQKEYKVDKNRWYMLSNQAVKSWQIFKLQQQLKKLL